MAKNTPNILDARSSLQLGKILKPEISAVLERKHRQIIAALGENGKKFGSAAIEITEKFGKTVGAIALGVFIGTAQGAEMDNKVALNTGTTSASVPTAEKGGGQVVTLKNGKSMSFYEISRLSGAEKDDILDNQIDDISLKEYQNWRKGMKEAANQEEKKIDANIQAGNQRVEMKKGVEQAAINKIILQIPQVVPRYEADIAQGKKIPLADKKALEFAIKAGEPKEWIKRIEKLLSNPQNFA